MEDKVLNILDNLEIEEAERLLNYDINIDIDKKAKHRIHHMVFKKAGLRSKPHYMSRKLVACAAAAIVLITSLSLVGIDNVKAAINQVFSFIPGYGIVENNDTIQYILSDTVSSENKSAILTLNNAVATEDSITVTFTLERKNYTKEQLLKDKQKEWDQLQKSDKSPHSNVILYTNGKEYTDYVGSTVGGTTDISNFTYTLNPEEINKDATYKLSNNDFNLSVEFKLKDYQTYNNLEEIGSTGYHNNISLTAVPTFVGDNVEVNIYSINNSQYRINSFNKIYYGYKGDDLNLITNSGIKSYNTSPDGFGGVNQKYIFKVKSTDTNFTLNIPYIVVQSNEHKNISLPIPKVDQEIDVNKHVKFKDSTMTIVQVKRVHNGSGGNDSLMLNIRYDNKKSNLIAFGANFNRINFWGQTQSGGYSSAIDTNDIESIIYYDLEKGDKNTLRLKISEPNYYLTDAYHLKLIENNQNKKVQCKFMATELFYYMGLLL